MGAVSSRNWLPILYLPMYKSTFYSLKICPKNRPRRIHGSKTIAYLKGNSKIKEKFFKKCLHRNKKNLFFGSKIGGRLIHGIDLYTGKYGSGSSLISGALNRHYFSDTVVNRPLLLFSLV